MTLVPLLLKSITFILSIRIVNFEDCFYFTDLNSISHKIFFVMTISSRGQRDVPLQSVGEDRRERSQQGSGAGHRGCLLQVFRRYQGVICAHENLSK